MIYELDTEFERNGTRWRVTAITDTFLMATRTDLDGEPERASDIIMVRL